MATYEIWAPNTASTSTIQAPLHTIEADKFYPNQTGIILFVDGQNNNLHAVTLTPGLMIKKVK